MSDTALLVITSEIWLSTIYYFKIKKSTYNFILNKYYDKFRTIPRKFKKDEWYHQPTDLLFYLSTNHEFCRFL